MKDKVIIDSPYIQDTPIIRGEDAKRFLQRMMEDHKETPEERDRREANYEMIMRNSEGYL